LLAALGAQGGAAELGEHVGHAEHGRGRIVDATDRVAVLGHAVARVSTSSAAYSASFHVVDVIGDLGGALGRDGHDRTHLGLASPSFSAPG